MWTHPPCRRARGAAGSLVAEDQERSIAPIKRLWSIATDSHESEMRMSANQLSVTMEAVAKLAGVSRATASRVLNGDTHVAPASARRVRKAAAQLGYVRNAAAAQLARRQSGLIGLLLRDATVPAYAYLQEALISQAKERGLFLVTVSTGRMGLVEDEIFAETSHVLRFLELRPAGVIVASGIIPADDIETIAAQVPTLVVPRPESREGLYTVGYDEEASAAAIARRVAEYGHRHVAVLSNDQSPTELLRARVMAGVLREHGVAVEVVEGNSLLDESPALARNLLGAVERGCTCVMFPNDVQAVRFLVLARERGLDVPGRVSVTGLDGYGDAVALADLATVRNPIEQVARTAIDTMEALVGDAHGQVPPKQLFPGTVREGSTLADLRQAGEGVVV